LSNIHHHIKQHEVPSSHIASQLAATHCRDVKSETSDRDVVHYFNDIVSAQRGYYQKQEIIDVLIICGFFFLGRNVKKET